MRRVLAIAAVAGALFGASASATDPTVPPPYKIRVCTAPGGACSVLCESTDVCIHEYPGGPGQLPHWCIHWDVYDPDNDVVCVLGNDFPPDIGPH